MMRGTFFPSGKNEMHRGPSFCCGMLFKFTDSKGASGPTTFFICRAKYTFSPLNKPFSLSFISKVGAP